MPIEKHITVYGCRFKCGRRYTQDRKWMLKHEETCFANPACRACKTCNHDIKAKDPNESYCDLDAADDGNRRPSSEDTLTCRKDCPDWQPKRWVKERMDSGYYNQKEM